MAKAHRVADLALVERHDQFAADPQQLAVLQQRRDQCGPRGPDSQLRQGIDAPHDVGHFLVGHDDSRAQRRKADLRQAHREYGVFVPLRPLVHVNHSREGKAIGIVDDQRYLPLARHIVKPRKFRLPNHVAGGVGGPGHDNGAEVRDFIQAFHAQAVLELAVRKLADARAAGGDVRIIGKQSLVADVFRAQRNDDPAPLAAGPHAAEEVEEIVKAELAAGRQGDIPGGQRPAVFLAEHIGHRLAETRISQGLRVDRRHVVETVGGGGDLRQFGAENFPDFGNNCRVAATQPIYLVDSGNGPRHVFHQLLRAAVGVEGPDKIGVLHWLPWLLRLRVDCQLRSVLIYRMIWAY